MVAKTMIVLLLLMLGGCVGVRLAPCGATNCNRAPPCHVTHKWPCSTNTGGL